MTFYPSSELLLDPSPPRVADSLPGQLAKGVARGAQLARRTDPRPFSARPRSGAGGFAMSLALEAWDLFTQEPVTPPLTGLALPALPPGQGFVISGSATFITTNPAFPDPQSTPIGSITVFAPLGNIEIRKVGDIEAVWVRAEIGTIQEGDRQLSVGFNGVLNRYVRIDSLTVVPQGEPENQIPGLLPYPNSPGDLDYPEDIPITVLVPRVIGRTPQPLLVPMIIPRPSDLGRRPVPILYPPGLTPDQRRALPQMWLTPEGVQVGRGYADDRVVSIPGGSIDIDLDIDLSSDYERREPPVVTTCTDTPEPPVDCCDCEEIRQIVIEELDSKFPPARPAELVTVSFPASDSISIVLPDFTQSVAIDIVVPPANRKEQEGNASAPNVFYNGWYSFGTSSFTGERVPLNYDNLSVPVPKDAKRFSYTIIGLGTATVTLKYLLPP